MEIIGAGDRLAARWKKFKKTVTGQSRTRLPDRVRTTRMGGETVRMTPGMRNMLPANQVQKRGQRNSQQTRGQTSAQRPVRCQVCGGWYGALKSGRPRAHRDLTRGNAPCPGGGATKKTPRKLRTR